MNNKIRADLKKFIESFCTEMKIKNIDIESIDLDTSIDTDLNIYDLDLDVFVNDFSQQFSVDTKQFDWKKQLAYPDGSDMNFMYIFFRSFNYKRRWVKSICKIFYTPKLFVRDFQNMIKI
ncbi:MULTISPECIES: DUF1493 family protein [Chitinophagaceae]